MNSRLAARLTVLLAALSACGPGGLSRSVAEDLIASSSEIQRRRLSSVRVSSEDELKAGSAAGVWDFKIEQVDPLEQFDRGIYRDPKRVKTYEPRLRAVTLKPPADKLLRVVRIQDADWMMLKMGATIEVLTPLSVRITGVTRVAAAPMSDGTTAAEFTWEFDGPAATHLTAARVIKARQGAAALRRFDDGWRVERVWLDEE
ncbi:MAG: hypothetical protein HMLKMBBP_01690 [Planctomycetes bacterium]|nr:hypothetical protein [Planctomycetota bacterium]